MFRFASAVAPPAARRCPQCFRPSPFPGKVRQSFRRQLQTATAHRPQTLGPEVPPPRNAGIPDTSIAGGIQTVDKTSPTQLQGNLDNVATRKTTEQDNVGLTEGEAQKSRAANVKNTTSPASSSETAAAKPRRSKLRPRKAAMTLSTKAVSQLKDLLDQPEPKLIRVGVRNRGCSGLAYHLEYVDKAGPFDESVMQDGVKVLIDSKALFSIIGSEMDWIEDKLNERFVFRNPNITEQCGCGESFSIS